MQIINSKTIIRAAQTDVWSVFTDPATWVTWYGGKLLGVDPTWQAGAILRWELGSPSTLRDVCAPERVAIHADNGLTTTWRFSSHDGKTLVEMEQDFRESHMVVADPRRQQRQCDEEVQGLKQYVEKAYPVMQASRSGAPVLSAKADNDTATAQVGRFKVWHLLLILGGLALVAWLALARR